ncbi:WXG100 family type VII secretion target [Mycobacterium sp. CVI_P3]|uniref:ESAT-6-like protein n=1 Tax=Mycobacterium pinniadriaticum TaxID=2994102 RepID=A0ABT3SMB1_9MYCO|nr:WXG100 family type VII secretion target [Mycobacterium pinniadriaticum]MCX2934246.1 WXG100 family type VII secretion target [Mycobacterium pinniadriaticum]MCX2940668.1 WXG100 family type VII secretion target [Mycobacterium pinniadriaticum]
MADAFAVDLDRLADIVDRMAAYQAVVDAMLEECDAVVANLHAQWEGVASEAHDAVHKQWKEGADMMRNALAQLRSAGAHAHTAYGGAIEANLKIWG